MSSDDLIKKYGEEAFQNGELFLSQPKEIVPVSPAINILLGGGIPEGSFVIFAGDPKVGKTVTSLHFAGHAQKQGRKVFYLDIENRLKQRDIVGTKNLDPSKIEIIRSYRNKETNKTKIFTAHEWLGIAETKAKEFPGSVVILDSVSQLLTEDELNEEIGKQHRAPVAMLMSKFCKRMSSTVPINGNIVIMIVHLIANTGFGLATKARSGGRKIQFAVDVDMEVKYTQRWKAGSGDDAPEIGKKLMWITGSTGIAAPGMKMESKLRYGKGLDEDAELFDLGKSAGLITGKGYYTLECMSNHLDVLGVEEWNDETKKMCKAQGEQKFLHMLEENPKFRDCLYNDIMEMMGIE